MIIAVDFDGTLVEHAYPKIGKEIPFSFDVLKLLQADGHQLILWSVREGELLEQAVVFCAERGIKFFAVNQNYEGEETPSPRKLNADLFIDDRNLGGLPDWGVIYRLIKAGGDSLTDFSSLIQGAEDNPQKNRKNFFIRFGEALDRAKGRRY